MPPLKTSRRTSSFLFCRVRDYRRLCRRNRKKPRIKRGFPSTFLHLSMMPEQSQEQDDRQGNAEQPKQCASSETHDLSPSQGQGKTPDDFWCSVPLRQNSASAAWNGRPSASFSA